MQENMPVRRQNQTMAVWSIAAMVAGGIVAVGGPFGTGPAAASTFDAAPAGTTGGAGRTVRTVTTLADTGTGSLRAALVAGGGDVAFAAGLSGDLRLASPVNVPSNTTLSGAAAAVTIVGQGLRVASVSNVVLRGLSFRGVTNDAVAVTSSSYVWISHVDFDGTGSVLPDGLLDVTQGSTQVTISWNRFTAHDKVMLLGAGAPDGAPPLVDMAIHHNLMVGTVSRNPMMRQGRFNVYNNVLDGWGLDLVDSNGYGIKASCGALARVEANIFRPRINLRGSYLTDEPTCLAERRPAVDLVANAANGAILVERDPARVTVAAPSAVQPADSVLEVAVRAGAGRRGASTLTATTTTAPTTTAPTTTAPTTTAPTTTTPTTTTPTTTTPITTTPTTTTPITTAPAPTTTTTSATAPGPKVVARTPATGATEVSRTTSVTATFSEAVIGVSTTTFGLKVAATGDPVSAVVSRIGTTNQWSLVPGGKLASKTRYTVTLVGGPAAVRSVAGTPLATTTWSFTTGSV